MITRIWSPAAPLYKRHPRTLYGYEIDAFAAVIWQVVENGDAVNEHELRYLMGWAVRAAVKEGSTWIIDTMKDFLRSKGIEPPPLHESMLQAKTSSGPA